MTKKRPFKFTVPMGDGTLASKRGEHGSGRTLEGFVMARSPRDAFHVIRDFGVMLTPTGVRLGSGFTKDNGELTTEQAQKLVALLKAALKEKGNR